MKPNPPVKRDWRELVNQARDDAAPVVDLRALQRLVAAEWVGQPTTDLDWRTQLLQVCSVSRALRWCVGGSSVCATVAGWQLWQVWQELAWAHFAGLGVGGGW